MELFWFPHLKSSDFIVHVSGSPRCEVRLDFLNSEALVF
uniref:UDP-glucosyltransferase n=1 Tax=Rhizophora mucronata TaxID=61149 RepID=A0A2P2NS98_RHIMU